MTRVNESKLESDFQGKILIPELRELFPGCIILKNDPNYLQGIPDLTIFWEGMYALLEVKAGPKSKTQPNQEWYIDLFNEWSFGAFIFPENKEAVLNELQLAFGTKRVARVPKRK